MFLFRYTTQAYPNYLAAGDAAGDAAGEPTGAAGGDTAGDNDGDNIGEIRGDKAGDAAGLTCVPAVGEGEVFGAVSRLQPVINVHTIKSDNTIFFLIMKSS